MSHSEETAIIQNQQNLFLLDKYLNKKKLRVNDLTDLVPGLFHLNRKEDFALEYVNKEGLYLLNNDLENIQKEGVDLILKITHPDTVKSSINTLTNLMNGQDESWVATHFQKLKLYGDDDYNMYLTTSKICKATGGLVSVTIPVQTFGSVANKIEKVFEETSFMKKNFRKFALLTKREKEILRLIALGKSSKEISEILFISLFTVNTHRQNMIRKLETSKVVELVKIAELYDLL